MYFYLSLSSSSSSLCIWCFLPSPCLSLIRGPVCCGGLKLLSSDKIRRFLLAGNNKSVDRKNSFYARTIYIPKMNYGREMASDVCVTQIYLIPNPSSRHLSNVIVATAGQLHSAGWMSCLCFVRCILKALCRQLNACLMARSWQNECTIELAVMMGHNPRWSKWNYLTHFSHPHQVWQHDTT